MPGCEPTNREDESRGCGDYGSVFSNDNHVRITRCILISMLFSSGVNVSKEV